MPFYDEKGFNLPRFNEINTLVQTYQESELSQKLDYSDDEPIYQLNSVYSRVADLVLQNVDESFQQLNIDNAEGVRLEKLARHRNVTRFQQRKSRTTEQEFAGDNGVVVPLGTILGSSLSDIRCATSQAVTLNPTDAKVVKLKFTTLPKNGDVISITINNDTITLTHNNENDLDPISIIYSRIALIANAQNPIVGREYSITFNATPNELDKELTVTQTQATPITVSSSNANLRIFEVTKNVPTESVEFGPVDIPTGLIDTLITPVSGVTLTTNVRDYTLGRFREEDVMLRTRAKRGSQQLTGGTNASIKSIIEDTIQGVTLVRVFSNENTSPVDTEGLPLYNTEVLVQGGDHQEIAELLWEIKPSGAPLFGNTNVPILDSNGTNQISTFSTPEEVSIQFEIYYELYEEEPASDFIESVIKSSIISYVESLGIGVDLIPTRVLPSIYQNTSGLGDIRITARLSGTGSYSREAIPIGTRQFTNVTGNDITLIRT